MKGSVILKTMATFCLNFFYFICCVKMDTVTMLKTEKQAITIGISVFALTLGVPLGLAFTMINYVAMDKSLADALPVIAVSQSLTVFISISVLLA
jgi:Kef-type K+ transport system membrane component KefB